MRKSQEPVRFDRFGGGWDVRESADENSPPPHVARRWLAPPPPLLRWVSPPRPRAPAAASPPPPPPPPPPRPRPPLGGVHDVNERALQREIAQLEKQVKHLNRVFEGTLTINRELVKQNASLARRLLNV
jgi:hypothetical protein